MYTRKWTPDEDAYLRKHYGKVLPEKLGKVLNRKSNAINIRASRLGIATVREWLSDIRREKTRREEAINLARHYDPFARAIPIFCIANVTVHLQSDGEQEETS